MIGKLIRRDLQKAKEDHVTSDRIGKETRICVRLKQTPAYSPHEKALSRH
jgi:hypothetical protein